MVFFLISLSICLLVSVVLLVFLIRGLHKNWQRKNRMPISYLTPVLLTAFFVLFTSGQTMPRLLDTVPLISRTLRIEEVEMEAGQIRWLTLELNQQRFWYNRWSIQLEPDTSYRISYTPYSRHILIIDEIVESTAQN